MMTPVEVVKKQLAAYNARDLDAFCACYSPKIVVERLIGNKLLFRGMEAFRKNYADRFSNPELHAKLINRIALGQVVIDQEEIVGFPGHNVLHAVAIYEVENGLIRKVRFERSAHHENVPDLMAENQ